MADYIYVDNSNLYIEGRRVAAVQHGLAPTIRDALVDPERPTKMEFTETPLQDAIDYLRDLHGIEIQLDTKALEDAGIGSETPVTRNLHGVSLKSGLRLLLRDMERVCALCHHKAQCDRDLADGAAAENYYGYCGNASTLESLDRTRVASR